MSSKSDIRTHETCVRSITIHAIETEAEITISKCLLRTMEIRTLSITGNTLRDRIRDEDICEIQDVKCARRRAWRDVNERCKQDG